MREVHLNRLLMNSTRATINNRSRMSQSLRTRVSTPAAGDKNYLLRCASADDESARVRNYKSIAKPRVCKFACSAKLNDEVDSVGLNANRCSPCHSFLRPIRFFLLVSGVRGPLKISLFITATNERLAEAGNKRSGDECRQTCIARGLWNGNDARANRS